MFANRLCVVIWVLGLKMLTTGELVSVNLKLLSCLFLMLHFYLSCNMNLDAKGTINCQAYFFNFFICLFNVHEYVN